MSGKAKPAKPLAHEAAGVYFSPEERIELALASIDPNLPREDWVKVGMALKSELGESGFLTFDEWSKGGQSYNARDARDTWKSFKPSGPVTIATLFKMATDSGWRPDRPAPPPPPPDPKKIERQQRAELKKQRDEASAAGNARVVYAQAKACQAHGYLKAKGLAPVKGMRVIDAAEVIRPGVSFGPDITTNSGRLLLVPIVDESGHIQSLEAITPEGVKGFLAGAKKREGFFVIGEKGEGGMVYVVEGLATGLSVHEASAARAHVAFDASNLKAVAESARRRFPDARIVIAGDWDESQTGQKKGKAAAAAVNGLAIFPDFAAVEGREFGDWNDLHAAAGIDEVKRLLSAALIQPAAPASAEPSGQNPEGSSPGTPASASRKSPYSVNDTGTWHTDADGEKTWICAALYVDAMTRNDRGEAWGRLLRFRDPEVREHVWPCPIKLLAGDGVAFREALMELGLVISPAKAARAHLSIYVQTAAPGRFVHCAEQTGWTEIDGHRVFVLPDTTIGPDTGTTRVLYQGPAARGYGVRGSLAEWQDSIGRWCNGNSRLTLAVSMALAGPLLGPCGAEGGGVHYCGSSSTGKSTAQYAAVSVTGAPESRQMWRGTSNGVEGIAYSHNDGLLALDEIGMVSPAEAGEIAYMLANGSEKLRGARTGGVREVRRWRLLFLSSGEIGLADHMLTVGKRARAGQEIRLLNIPADTGKFGVFEELHGHTGGAAFSKAIEQTHRKFYGTAFRAFLEKVTAMDQDELVEWVDLKREEFIRTNLAGADPSGQAIRAGHRFAIIAAAGELAAQFGIVPWPDGAASWAARVCFDAWLKARGGAGNQEPRDMLAQVRHFLEQHGESRFTPWACERCDGTGKAAAGRYQDVRTGEWGDGIGTCHMCNGTGRVLQRTVNACGYRRFVKDKTDEGHRRHYLVYPESWRVDVCSGFDFKAVTALCRERGIINPSTDGKSSRHETPPGEKKKRFYVLDLDSDGWEQ